MIHRGHRKPVWLSAVQDIRHAHTNRQELQASQDHAAYAGPRECACGWIRGAGLGWVWKRPSSGKLVAVTAGGHVLVPLRVFGSRSESYCSRGR